MNVFGLLFILSDIIPINSIDAITSSSVKLVEERRRKQINVIVTMSINSFNFSKPR